MCQPKYFYTPRPPGPYYTGAVKAYEVRSRRGYGTAIGTARRRALASMPSSMSALAVAIYCTPPATHAPAESATCTLTAYWNGMLVLAYVPAGFQSKRGRNKACAKFCSLFLQSA